MKDLRFRICCVLVLAAICGVYSNHFENSFHFDDFTTITQNPAVRDLHNFPRFFTDARTLSILSTNQTYRPLIPASLAIDYHLGRGYNVFWFHLSTFLVFLVQLVLMYFLFKAVLEATVPQVANRYIALIAAGWYGLHPAIAETVNYIFQRADLYSTCGVMGGLVLWIYWPALRRTGLYLIPVILGSLAKQPALVFPGILFCWIFYFEEDCRFDKLGQSIVKTLPAAMVSVALFCLQAIMTPATYVTYTGSLYLYWLTEPFVWMRYFGSFLLPVHLNADSDLQAFSDLNAEALLGLLFVTCLAAAIWITMRKPLLRPVSFGLVWFAVASLPASVFPQVELENDHRMSFPFVGLVLAFCWALMLLFKYSRYSLPSPIYVRMLASFALCAAAGYGYGTWERNRVWRTEESLWHDDVLKSPRNARGLMNYGLTQMEKGRCDSALTWFETAAKYNPDYPLLDINLAIENGCNGNKPAAERHFNRAIALAPIDARSHYYYAVWLNQEGRFAEALLHAQSAVSMNLAWMEARTLLMDLYDHSGDADLARRVADSTLRISPSDADAQRYLQRGSVHDADYWVGVSLRQYQEHQYDKCISAAREALKLRSGYAEAYNNIAAAYQAMGKWDESIVAAQQALQIKPGLEIARRNLLWSMEQKQKVAGSPGQFTLPGQQRE